MPVKPPSRLATATGGLDVEEDLPAPPGHDPTQIQDNGTPGHNGTATGGERRRPRAQAATADEPPPIAIWGPPVAMTSWSLRVPTRWQRWAKQYFGIAAATNNLPEGVLPKVIGQFVSEHREEIVRRAIEAVGSGED